MDIETNTRDAIAVQLGETVDAENLARVLLASQDETAMMATKAEELSDQLEALDKRSTAMMKLSTLVMKKSNDYIQKQLATIEELKAENERLTAERDDLLGIPAEAPAKTNSDAYSTSYDGPTAARGGVDPTDGIKRFHQRFTGGSGDGNSAGTKTTITEPTEEGRRKYFNEETGAM